MIIIRKIKHQIQNAQNRRSCEIASRIFEIYDDAMRPHCCNIHNTASDMAMVKMFHFTYEHNALPHWKCVFHCCDKCPSIVITSQESNGSTTNTCPKICFHVYKMNDFVNFMA